MSLNATFYEANRRHIIEKIGGSYVVLGAHRKLQQQSDMAYAFSQEPNFWYVTGITEADWYVVIAPDGKDFLIRPERDEVHITFDGETAEADIIQLSGIHKILDPTEGQRELRRIARTHKLVHTVDHPSYASHYDFSCNPAIGTTKRMLKRIFDSVQDCTREFAVLRAIKQPEEVKIMQSAIDCTVAAFKQVREQFESFNHEYEIEAAFTYAFGMLGGYAHAYTPIVASGKNACTLHYINNRSPLRSGSLVLIDIGANVEGYAADITRTYEYKKSSKRQQQVQQTVVNAHEQIIKLIEPGLPVDLYQSNVDQIMTNALKELRLYESEASLRRYFPHAISHGLGIDVHDSLGAPRQFAENMVLTVEPGIYIPEENIGVRIEDDILVTKTGRRNMSAKLSTAL